MNMSKGTRRTIRGGLMVVGICASLAVTNLGFSGTAEARMPEGDRMSETAEVCGAIQDGYDVPHNFYEMSGNIQDLVYWQSQMLSDIAAWHDAGCDQYYGSITYRVGQTTSPKGRVNGAVLESANLSTGGVQPANGGKTLSAGKVGTSRTLAR